MVFSTARRSLGAPDALGRTALVERLDAMIGADPVEGPILERAEFAPSASGRSSSAVGESLCCWRPGAMRREPDGSGRHRLAARFRC